MLVTLLNNPAFSPAHITTASRRCAVRASESAVATREDTFAAKKAALIAGPQREYATFFQPMETELYSPDVEFVDPLINLQGVDAYANNVGMLAGSTLAGKILFRDCDLILTTVTCCRSHVTLGGCTGPRLTYLTRSTTRGATGKR